MKKILLRPGVFFGIVMSAFFIVTKLCGIENYTWEAILRAVTTGILAGALSGFLFSYFVKKTIFSEINGSKFDVQEGEGLLLESSANHCLGLDVIAGKLRLTNQRLIFESDKYHMRNYGFAMNLEDVIQVKPFQNTRAEVGITILLKEDHVEKFVVEEADEWIRKLNGGVER